LRTKRLSMLFVCVFLAVALAMPLAAGCAKEPEEPTDTYHWRMGQVRGPEEPGTKLYEDFAGMVEEGSNGRIKIDVYPACQLGDWTEMFEMCMVGTMEIGLTPAVDSYDARLGIDFAPYRFFTWDQAREAYQADGWMIKVLEPMYEDNNIKLLGYALEGFTGLSLNECPGVLPPEHSGIKIRTVPIASWEAAWEALGYVPTAIPYAEIYTSIQTGVVEGQAGGGTQQLYHLVADIQGCWLQTNDWMDNSPTGINLDLWNSLAPADQKLLMDTMDDLLWGPDGFNYRVEDLESVWLEKAEEEYGIQNMVIDEAQLALCAKAAREAAWPGLEPDLGPELYKLMVDNSPAV